MIYCFRMYIRVKAKTLKGAMRRLKKAKIVGTKKVLMGELHQESAYNGDWEAIKNEVKRSGGFSYHIDNSRETKAGKIKRKFG